MLPQGAGNAKTSIPAFATRVAGSHYLNVGLIDLKSGPQSLVLLVIQGSCGAGWRQFPIITYRLTQAVHIGSVNKSRHASRHIDLPGISPSSPSFF